MTTTLIQTSSRRFLPDSVARLKSWLPNRNGRNGAGKRAAATFAARLTFDCVRRLYGAKAAVNDVSLQVEAGEIVCMLGPSGCGKTTLLRIAAGIERPSSGRVLLNDDVVAGPSDFVPPEQRGVGLMFQDFALFPHLTIAGNVAFGLRALAKVDARREALAMLDRVGLADYADKYPHILSGGQQQRVALARAIVPRPAVMLMDEPFSGLDVQLRESMQEQTLALLRETRATAMIVTHHAEEAMRLADRIAVMREGRLVQLGTAEELYTAPGDLFVARLFSEINELSYRARGGAIETPFGRLPVTNVADGASVVVGLRQRAIGMRPGHNGGLNGRVIDVKFLGDAVLTEVAAEGFHRPLRVRTTNSSGIAKGAEVVLSIDAEQVLLFPSSLQEDD